MKRLIGVNGGTFDPIHFGHLRSALEVLMALELDEVKFIPSFQPVHKDAPCVSAVDRCEMVRLAIKRQPLFSLDTIEVDREGASFMVDTLSTLKKKNPDDTLVLMMGVDAFAKFDSWHKWQDILEVANLAIMNRPGCVKSYSKKVNEILKKHKVESLNLSFGQVVELSVTQLDLSATALRSFLQKNETVDYLMPASVVEYIQKNNLY